MGVAKQKWMRSALTLGGTNISAIPTSQWPYWFNFHSYGPELFITWLVLNSVLKLGHFTIHLCALKFNWLKLTGQYNWVIWEHIAQCGIGNLHCWVIWLGNNFRSLFVIYPSGYWPSGNIANKFLTAGIYLTYTPLGHCLYTTYIYTMLLG